MTQITGNVFLEHVHRYALAVDIAEGRHVLDIASGEGYGSNLLAGVAASVVGVDISPEAVAHAQAKYGRDGLEYRTGSCSAIPAKDSEFDLVVSFETIEHIEDQEAFLQELRRVLAPSGTLVICTPDKAVYSDARNYKNEFHVREFYRDEFGSFLRREFDEVRFYYQRVMYGSWIAPAQLRNASAIGLFRGGLDGTHFDEGLPNGMYMIAVCSDGDPPSLPCGMFQGEDEELRRAVDAVHAISRNCDRVHKRYVRAKKRYVRTKRLAILLGLGLIAALAVVLTS